MKRRKLLLGVLVLGGLLALGFYIARFEMRPEALEVYFLHLNRGRSIFIRTPHNKTILIDGGQSGDVIRELTKILPFYRRRIDMVIVTSALPKNSGGLGEVVGRFDVGKVVVPEIVGTSTAYEVFMETVDAKELEVQKVKKGDRFEIDGVEFGALFPDSAFRFNKSSLPELVLHLKYNEISMLFLGDVSKTIQKSLIPYVGEVKVVEFAHGGADSRVSAPLMEKLNPSFYVINKKETNRTSSAVKKFDIDSVDSEKIINLEKRGTARLEFK